MSEVLFPPQFEPSRGPLFTHNELLIEAPREQVWAWLVRASRWPEWYGNCRDLRFDRATPGPDLTHGSRFDWITFGFRVRTVIEEFIPGERLAWSGVATGGRGYHGWVLEPRGAKRCRVVTEEVQRGLVPTVGGFILRRQLLAWHQRWLEGLAQRAATGLPS